MMNPAKDLGDFASTSSIRAQKGYIVTFSVAALILFYGGLAAKLNSKIFGDSNIDEQSAIKICHYILIYMILHYCFNYIIVTLRYTNKSGLVRAGMLSVISAGLYIIMLGLMDFLMPIGLASFTLFKMNGICNNCILGANDNFAKDFGQFYTWTIKYATHLGDIIIALVSDIYKNSEAVRYWYDHLALPAISYISDLSIPFKAKLHQLANAIYLDLSRATPTFASRNHSNYGH